MSHPDAVFEAGVGGPAEHVVARAQLLQVVQTLERRAVNDLNADRLQGDHSVN